MSLLITTVDKVAFTQLFCCPKKKKISLTKQKKSFWKSSKSLMIFTRSAEKNKIEEKELKSLVKLLTDDARDDSDMKQSTGNF